MNTISTVLSSVGSFSDTTKNQYSSMLALANEVLRQANDMLEFVQEEKSKAEKQVIRFQKIEEAISNKINIYYIGMENAYSRYQYFSEQYYASRDDDDDIYFSNMMEKAYKLYTELKEKHDAAQLVEKDIQEQFDRLNRLLNAINTVRNALERNSFEIRKYISLIEDEASYNVQALIEVVNSIQTYVTSRKIFSTYEINSVSDSSSSSSYVSVGSKKENKSSSFKTPRSFKLKSVQTIEQYLTREGQKKPIYRCFNVYSPPVKNMILQATMRLGPNFQHFILKQLEGVIFLNAQHGFAYGANNKNGSTIRIIGMDLNDPAFSRNFLMHVGHHIYLTTCTQEEVLVNNFASREAQINIKHANANIQRLSTEIATSNPSSHRKTTIKSTPGSKFFSSCFQAYVNQDQEFLNAVKESYSESYRIFSDIMSRIPHN